MMLGAVSPTAFTGSLKGLSHGHHHHLCRRPADSEGTCSLKKPAVHSAIAVSVIDSNLYIDIGRLLEVALDPFHFPSPRFSLSSLLLNYRSSDFAVVLEFSHPRNALSLLVRVLATLLPFARLAFVTASTSITAVRIHLP